MLRNRNCVRADHAEISRMVPHHTQTFQTRKPIEGVRHEGVGIGIQTIAIIVAVVVLFFLLADIVSHVRRGRRAGMVEGHGPAHEAGWSSGSS